MKVKVALYPSEEGFAVSVPSLPGCWSQGTTREEALANIADAIRDYSGSEAVAQSFASKKLCGISPAPPTKNRSV
ncbi:MAG TPA: type II toxin-antitoxin system HicB family antitoxin [Terriglobia bacterium]|nr:type II toxin-antitoxin system HicB family antitoxin [Terriglobia bacterium]